MVTEQNFSISLQHWFLRHSTSVILHVSFEFMCIGSSCSTTLGSLLVFMLMGSYDTGYFAIVTVNFILIVIVHEH